MEEKTLESYHPSFQCCVCLDLLFKPVVLACGHMSCFWCVHKAMHGLRASHCAVCRQPYFHFPSVCELLHLLVSKVEPEAYMRREKEVLEEEKRLDVFSPQFNSFSSQIICSDGISSGSSRNDGDSLVKHENSRPSISTEVSLQHNGSKNEILLDISMDVLCALCHKLLFQPTVLNCGHVFCEPCLAGLGSETLKCHVCKSMHPGEFPKICLDFEHFLEEQFPNEYNARREGLQQLEKVKFSCGESSPSVSGEAKSAKSSKNLKNGYLWLDENLSKVNVGVGCDSCGMYPIIGKRYKCQDCIELVGFDLCESCYNTSSKLPGRFNQQHTPDHQFKLDDSHMLYKILLIKSSLMEDSYQDIFEEQSSVEEGEQNGGVNASDENADGSNQIGSENVDGNNQSDGGNI